MEWKNRTKTHLDRRVPGGREELFPPLYNVEQARFEKDPGSKMRGAHAVGAYLSTTLPVEPNPRGLKLKVNRAADADSPLRALTRRSEKRRGAQQPRCHEARCNGAKHLIDDGICGGATMRFSSSFFPKKRSAKRSFCPPIWMNAHATWWWSKKKKRIAETQCTACCWRVCSTSCR